MLCQSLLCSLNFNFVIGYAWVCVWSVQNGYGACIGGDMYDYVHVEVRRGCWVPYFTPPLPHFPVKGSLILLLGWQLASLTDSLLISTSWCKDCRYVQPSSLLCGFWSFEFRYLCLPNERSFLLSNLPTPRTLKRVCVLFVCISTYLCVFIPFPGTLKTVCFNTVHMG